MLRKLLGCLTLAASLGACTTIKALKSQQGGSYRSYVDKHLKEERIFDRGRELLIAKVLPVTQEYREEQKKLSPVVTIRPRDGIRQVIMALNVTGREPANLSNWELRLGNRKSVSVTEVHDDEVIEHDYYFGYPFYRVFVVEFPHAADGSLVENLDVSSPYGRVSVKCDFIDL